MSTPGRLPISKGLRFQILQRDGFICQYCGAHGPTVELAIDHVIPVKLGGLTKANNLVTACRPCNAGKASRALDRCPMAGSWEDPLDFPPLAPFVMAPASEIPVMPLTADAVRTLVAVADAEALTFYKWVRRLDSDERFAEHGWDKPDESDAVDGDRWEMWGEQ